MKNKNNIKTITIPSNWTAKQEEYYFNQLKKAGFKVIIEYI
tara:strand:- start:2017 stop:2139 length:123 start_codon:yes stop_codon:yes gene_type:complete